MTIQEITSGITALILLIKFFIGSSNDLSAISMLPTTEIRNEIMKIIRSTRSWIGLLMLTSGLGIGLFLAGTTQPGRLEIALTAFNVAVFCGSPWIFRSILRDCHRLLSRLS